MPVGANRLVASPTVVGATATFNRPSGTLDTDLCVFACSNATFGVETATKPVGFSQSPTNYDDVGVNVFFLVGAAGSATSWQMSIVNTTCMWAFIGVYPDAQCDVSTDWFGPRIDAGSGATITTELIPRTQTDGALVFAISSALPAPTLSSASPSPYRHLATAGNNGKGRAVQSISVGQEVAASIASGGTRFHTLNASDWWETGALLLRPTSTGGTTPPPPFPWKGLGTARPWRGLGTDTFKGLTA